MPPSAQRQMRTFLHRPRSRTSVLEIDFSVVERTSLDLDDQSRRCRERGDPEGGAFAVDPEEDLGDALPGAERTQVHNITGQATVHGTGRAGGLRRGTEEVELQDGVAVEVDHLAAPVDDRLIDVAHRPAGLTVASEPQHDPVATLVLDDPDALQFGSYGPDRSPV
jgi:hypothetical protein